MFIVILNSGRVNPVDWPLALTMTNHTSNNKATSPFFIQGTWECNLTAWLFNTIPRINEKPFSWAQSTSFTMSVMRNREERQLTFKSGAHLIGNGAGAVPLCDLAQCKYLTRSSLKWMNVKKWQNSTSETDTVCIETVCDPIFQKEEYLLIKYVRHWSWHSICSATLKSNKVIYGFMTWLRGITHRRHFEFHTSIRV